MNWQPVRDILKPNIVNFDTFGLKNEISKKNRNKILANANFSCRYCGGIYSKYMNCIKINEYDFDACCRACYLITHLNCGSALGLNHVGKEIKLYYSIIPQYDIVRFTINYILKNDKIPLVTDIDKDIKLSPISLYEYINIISNNKEYQDTILKNYKIFFSSKFDTTFIKSNYGINQSMFIDVENDDLENVLDSEKNNNIDLVLDEYKLLDDEKKILGTLFLI